MPSSGETSRLRVLLVEDEIMVALLLEEMLADLGHEVVGPVARLDKAVAMARQEALDIAILDVNLNGKEVFPVAAVLSARGIPFFFVTATAGRACARPMPITRACRSHSCAKRFATCSPRCAVRSRSDAPHRLQVRAVASRGK
jgi:CheY-like chemotaxis protein